jgi:hypothetical protein
MYPVSSRKMDGPHRETVTVSKTGGRAGGKREAAGAMEVGRRLEVGKGLFQRKEARRSFGPTGDPLDANHPAVVYWAPSLFHLCPAGG